MRTCVFLQAFAKVFQSTPDDLDMHVVYDVSHNIAKVRITCDGVHRTLYTVRTCCQPAALSREARSCSPWHASERTRACSVSYTSPPTHHHAHTHTRGLVWPWLRREA